MISGVWVAREQYRMTDSVSGKVKLVLVPGAGYNELVEQSELEEIVLECQERFEAEVRGAQVPKPMSRNTQHDLGKTLQEIGASKTHRKESLHSRYW